MGCAVENGFKHTPSRKFFPAPLFMLVKSVVVGRMALICSFTNAQTTENDAISWRRKSCLQNKVETRISWKKWEVREIHASRELCWRGWKEQKLYSLFAKSLRSLLTWGSPHLAHLKRKTCVQAKSNCAILQREREQQSEKTVEKSEDFRFMWLCAKSISSIGFVTGLVSLTGALDYENNFQSDFLHHHAAFIALMLIRSEIPPSAIN